MAQRTKLFAIEIIISMGQNEFEINRLPGVMRVKKPFFIRKCDTESKNMEMLKIPADPPRNRVIDSFLS
ncbi:hypothetical protein AB9K28_11920 [Enterobacter asburiae]